MSQQPPAWLSVTPAVFVVLWATGFIGAKFGLPYAEPFTFLTLRFWLVALLFGLIVLVTGAPRPASLRQAVHNLVVGVLLHGIYLGGVFAAIAYGMPAGLSALIVGLQPAMTALVARPLFGLRITALQWLGIILGFSGLVLVVGADLDLGAGATAGVDVLTLALCIAGLAGITAGSLYQKAFCAAQDLRTGAFLQYVGGASIVTVPALLFETNEIAWTPEFLFALGWLIVVLSFGAVTLLMLIIRHGDMSRVTAMFYLVPPVTVLMAWALFDERLTALQLAGIAVAAIGVMLVSRAGRPAART
jgi:drug/metabolite transporter (DMT)-like permease